ncbi:MAG TPA: aminoglycoside phosphotransferase family protein [Ktedonobacterales bacterium]|jgi:aminoglycoside phosphotransferase (APT) family kinase protein|nr:aminoglycoside phosphotransferase family protein [Ktedonobacterales bacterium]
MSPDNMHTDETRIDAALVRRLLTAQFPQWADLPLAPVRSAGTDNALYRLGAEMVVRLPRHETLDDVDKQNAWLPRLAPHLPLAIPTQLAQGAPGEGYPWRWSIYRWLDGADATVQPFTDPNAMAAELARFVAALRRIDATGGPPASRAAPLATQDTDTRAAIAAVSDMLDADAATAAWEAALQAPVWEGPPVWIHGDLTPLNLLAHEGRLSAVIDWGAAGVGDPACDLCIAWNYLSGETRDIYRATLAVDDAMWERGRGWALSIGLIALPYYQHSNPALAAIARRHRPPRH